MRDLTPYELAEEQRDKYQNYVEDEEELSECCGYRLENERCMECFEFSGPLTEE